MLLDGLKKNKQPGNHPAPIFDVTAEDFEAKVLVASKDTPVIVDFWAPWCGPCRMIAPMVEELASENMGSFKIGKINIDDLITHVVPLEQINDTFDLMHEGKSIRSVVTF